MHSSFFGCASIAAAAADRTIALLGTKGPRYKDNNNGGQCCLWESLVGSKGNGALNLHCQQFLSSAASARHDRTRTSACTLARHHQPKQRTPTVLFVDSYCKKQGIRSPQSSLSASVVSVGRIFAIAHSFCALARLPIGPQGHQGNQTRLLTPCSCYYQGY